MSTMRPSLQDDQPQARTLRVRSVVGLAHDEIRSMIVSGAIAPGSRLGQGELADQLGISRGSVREALRRLAGDGLVEFEVNRGFFVADVGLDNVRQRLEARLTIEPEITRLAAERRTVDDLERMREAIELEEAAPTSDDAHDASRAFHLAVAAATGNDAFVRLLESLWIADVGRRLLAERRRAPSWQHDDVAEHRAILAAVESRSGRRAAQLMRAHVESAVHHWSPRGPADAS
jgi:DNA-binding GntR family transcriptional regulator